MSLWALIAPEGFAHETERELAYLGLRPRARHENFFLFEGEPRAVAWSAVIWREVQIAAAPSINQAARALKPLARKWEHFPTLHRGRAALVHAELRPYRLPTIRFPSVTVGEEGVGAFTMMGEKELLWSRSFDRPDPLGRMPFAEDRDSAPSRAYLKLWESLCLLGEWPKPNELSLDLGSSPGGWTWVLASLGARVISIDRSPLEPRIALMSGVEFRRGDAFSVRASSLGEVVEWLCCDVICAPEKLLGLVQEWTEAGTARRFVCTLKFQGEADPAHVAQFAKLGRVLHLHHNKHELTFLR